MAEKFYAQVDLHSDISRNKHPEPVNTDGYCHWIQDRDLGTVIKQQFTVRKQQIVDASMQEWSDCLVKVGRDSDRQAFQQIFDKFSPLIKAFAGRQLSGALHDALAEDLVQETMIKVWQKADSFDPKKANASTWIFTIARNTRIDLLRKNIRHQSNRVTNDQSEDGIDVEDIWVENEDEDVFNQLAVQRTVEMLHESMKELPDEQSFILKKVYLEDKSHSEIAEELSLPLGTVKSRVRLALSKLRLSVER